MSRPIIRVNEILWLDHRTPFDRLSPALFEYVSPGQTDVLIVLYT